MTWKCKSCSADNSKELYHCAHCGRFYKIKTLSHKKYYQDPVAEQRKWESLGYHVDWKR